MKQWIKYGNYQLAILSQKKNGRCKRKWKHGELFFAVLQYMSAEGISSLIKINVSTNMSVNVNVGTCTWIEISI